MNIKKINLNLLIAFDALILECSVSAAAKRCHVTQAAMSNTLKQLRELFSDPLFIRESKGIKPTPKALTLHKKIRDALSSIEEVFTEESFDPKISTREFHLALSDHGENLILPKLYDYMSKHAPAIKLRVTPYTHIHDIERLSTDIDIAIGANYGIPQQIYSEPLLLENGVIVMNKHHVYANKNLTMKSYLSLKHIAVNFNPHSGLTYIDSALKKSQQSRNVIMYLTNISTALSLIKTTDLVGTFPKSIVTALTSKNDFAIKKMPFAINDYVVSILYHKRYSTDPAHAWLIGIIKMLVKP
jgi:DNA-binding transcriptional LysR family regulator